MHHARLVVSALTVVVSAFASQAQEPFFMDSATHPSRGMTAVRVLALHRQAEEGGIGQLRLKAAYGLRSDWALLGEGGGRFGSDDGFDHAALRIKWRFARFDLGPVNTVRASLLAGTEIPAGSGDDDGWNPVAGAVVTAILGRHGVNAGAGYRRMTSGDRAFDDEYRADAAYLYRLHPRRYDAGTRASWYAVSEWNARARGEEDYEVRWVPGLLYEAWRWAAEIGAIVPLAHERETIERTHWGVVGGLRTLF